MLPPAPVPELKEVSAASVIELAKEMFAFEVTRFPPKETFPLPFCVKEPESVMAPAAVLVNVPLLVMVRGPPPVVVMAAPRVIAPAATAIPAAPEVVRGPLKIVVPVPAVSRMDVA